MYTSLARVFVSHTHVSVGRVFMREDKKVLIEENKQSVEAAAKNGAKFEKQAEFLFGQIRENEAQMIELSKAQ